MVVSKSQLGVRQLGLLGAAYTGNLRRDLTSRYRPWSYTRNVTRLRAADVERVRNLIVAGLLTDAPPGFPVRITESGLRRLDRGA